MKNNCPLSIVALAIDVKVFMGRGHADKKEQRHIFVGKLYKRSHFWIALDILCSNLTAMAWESHISTETNADEVKEDAA